LIYILLDSYLISLLIERIFDCILLNAQEVRNQPESLGQKGQGLAAETKEKTRRR